MHFHEFLQFHYCWSNRLHALTVWFFHQVTSLAMLFTCLRGTALSREDIKSWLRLLQLLIWMLPSETGSAQTLSNWPSLWVTRMLAPWSSCWMVMATTTSSRSTRGYRWNTRWQKKSQGKWDKGVVSCDNCQPNILKVSHCGETGVWYLALQKRVKLSNTV